LDQPSATAAMTDDTPLLFDLPSVQRKKITVDFDGGNQSSDGGLVLLREAERKLGVCRRLAAAMPDRCDADRVQHAMFEMVMARASAIACGYEDAISLGKQVATRPLPIGDDRIETETTHPMPPMIPNIPKQMPALMSKVPSMKPALAYPASHWSSTSPHPKKAKTAR
jgi:hypothetical protein